VLQYIRDLVTRLGDWSYLASAHETARSGLSPARNIGLSTALSLGCARASLPCERGLDTVLGHARKFVAERLAPATPANDGKQTPYRGHPVFVAQHATACCCRGCLQKWHGIPRGQPLSKAEQEHVLAALERWLRAEAG
jgi:hypothetical protein